MGFQWRKRTKGKGAWINFSYSEKNGFNASLSGKAGPFTLNTGNGATTKRRVTTNLGNGLRHVAYDTSSKPHRDNERVNEHAIMVRWLIFTLSSMVAWGLFDWWGVLAVVAIAIYRRNRAC